MATQEEVVRKREWILEGQQCFFQTLLLKATTKERKE